MSKKLNQVLAIEKSLKGRAETVFATYQHASQREELLDGFAKTFQAVKDGDATRPNESRKVQHTAKEIFGALTKVLAELFTTTASKDTANCTARADVRVGGKVLLANVPSTNLLFLDKKLTELYAFVSKFAELKSDTNWAFDPNTGYYRSEEIKSQVTAKEQKPLVLYAATPQHPAQTQLITQDVIIGYWTTTKQSGALPHPVKIEILEKIQALQYAVKEALEEANTVEAPDNDYGATIMAHLFGSVV